MPRIPTSGEVFRELVRYYDYDVYAMKVAINDHRRTHGSKNFVAAAMELLTLKQEEHHGS